MNLLNRYNRSFSQFLYGKKLNASLRDFCYGGYPPTSYKKSSSANMKNACIDAGDVDGGDYVKVE